MKNLSLFLFVLLISFNIQAKTTYQKYKDSFNTQLYTKQKDQGEFAEPPKQWGKLVQYDTKLGKMNAYLTHAPNKNEKHPAIIWVSGGFPPGGAGKVWQPRNQNNDQSAAQYWRSGIVTMYPAFRGAAGNPGYLEGFVGEVDDLLAAYTHLSKIDYVDPKRIYLGGHSTGATLVLLAAAASDKFAGVIAFGPVARAGDYGSRGQYHNTDVKMENFIRSPINFLKDIKSPTLILEGINGNLDSLQELKSSHTSENISYQALQNNNHFSILAPLNQILAMQIKENRSIQLTSNDILENSRQLHLEELKQYNLKTVKRYTDAGINPSQSKRLTFLLLTQDKQKLSEVRSILNMAKLSVSEVWPHQEEGQPTQYVLEIFYDIALNDQEKLLIKSINVDDIANEHTLIYAGWAVKPD